MRTCGRRLACYTTWITNAIQIWNIAQAKGIRSWVWRGWGEETCRAILSHADYTNVSRETPLEKTLFAVDELSSFVIAVALVRPTKSIHDVDVAAVKKKMKDKAFARAVNRDDILRGAAELGMPFDDVIAEVVNALKSDADRLGLVGTA